MGCCYSTHDHKHSSLHQFPCVSKSPPRAEEEAVKEVLSETPKPNSPGRVLVQDVDELTKPKLLLLTPTKKFTTGYPDPCTPEAISEASEMCSFSESVSTTTFKEDDDLSLFCKETVATGGEALRRAAHRSHHQGYGGNFSHTQLQPYKNQARSPARRRPEPSPPRRRNPSPSGPRGENASSGRRSQSPGMRGNNVGRSPSARRTGPSPGRVRMVGPESGRKVEVEREEAEEVGLRRESEEWQGPKESLENPLVSLECFIFL